MQMKNTYIIFLSLFLMLSLLGCIENKVQLKPETKQISELNNEFAINFYKQVSKGNQSNIFFSPYSIFSSSAMFYEGAKGDTAQEMLYVFHFPEDNETRRTGFKELAVSLNNANTGFLFFKDIELKTGNSLWLKKGFSISDFYKNILNNYYNAHIQELDFENDKSGSANKINSWIEQNTNNKIKNAFNENAINENTRLILINAVYFKGQWKTVFDKKKTRKMDFYTNNKTFKIDMMFSNDERYNFTSINKTRIIELPYKGDRLSMFIILPEKGKLTEFENSLTYEKIKYLKSKMQELELSVVAIPKFKFESSYMLNGYLTKLGIKKLFTSSADLSGISNNKDLFVSNIIHQAFIEVNEQGTEAAAITIYTKVISAAMQPVFIADHPFIFFIEDKETGEILFMGRYSKP